MFNNQKLDLYKSTTTKKNTNLVKVNYCMCVFSFFVHSFYSCYRNFIFSYAKRYDF